MRDDQSLSCFGKVRHATQGEAKKGILARQRGGRFSPTSTGARGRMNAYKCKHCGSWHVGGTPL